MFKQSLCIIKDRLPADREFFLNLRVLRFQFFQIFLRVHRHRFKTYNAVSLVNLYFVTLVQAKFIIKSFGIVSCDVRLSSAVIVLIPFVKYLISVPA